MTTSNQSTGGGFRRRLVRALSLGVIGLMASGVLGVQEAGTATPPRDQELTIKADEMAIPLAIPLSQSLQNDVAIRLTNEAFAFLARDLQRLLYGWTRRDQVNTEAVEAIPEMLRGLLMGFKVGFEDSDFGLEACIYLKNTNNEDQRNGTCSCNEGQPSHGSPQWSDSNDCSQCWFGEPGDNNDPPNGGWNISPNDPCMRNAANGGSGSPGDGGVVYGDRLAYYADPSDPDADPHTDGYYWCKGPFFDGPLEFDKFQYDPDCLKRDPTSDSEPCPKGAHTTEGCDNVCDYDNGSINDIPISLVGDPINDRLLLDVRLRGVLLDARLAASALGCTCCADPSGGALLSPQEIVINGLVRMTNGYYGMWRTDGEGGGSGGGGIGGGGKGSCDPGAGGSGDCGNGTCAWPETCKSCPDDCGACPDALNDHPSLGVTADLTSLTLNPGLDAGDINLYHCVDDDGWACGGYICDFADVILPLLEGTIEDLLKDEIAALLVDEVQALVEDELGLPVDFNMLIGGAGSGLRKNICSLRLESGHEHGLTCDHDNNRDCPCDDYDGDGLLNYQDARPWGSSTTPRFTGAADCNRGDEPHVWCGRFNTPDGDYYYNWMYGVGSLYPEDNGIFFETGVRVDDEWDTDGINLILSPTIVPWKERDTSQDDAPNGANNANPYQGMYPDVDEIYGGGLPLNSGMSGQMWDDYLNSLDPDTAINSCYFDQSWEGGAGNLFLDATERDDSLTDGRDEAEVTIIPKWMTGQSDGYVRWARLDGGSVSYDKQEQPHTDTLDVYLSQKGDVLATGGDNKTATIYRLQGTSWAEIQQITHPQGSATSIPAVAVSPSGDYIALGSDQGHIAVYEWDGTQYQFHTDFVYGQTNGPNCAACGANCNACRHDACGCEDCSLGESLTSCGCAECNLVTSYQVCGCAQCDTVSDTRGCYPSGCPNCGECASREGTWQDNPNTVCNGCVDCDGDGWGDSADGCGGWGGDSAWEKCSGGGEYCVNCAWDDWLGTVGSCDDSNDEQNSCQCDNNCAECGCESPNQNYDPCAGNYNFTNDDGESGLCAYNNCRVGGCLNQGSCVNPENCRACGTTMNPPQWYNNTNHTGDSPYGDGNPQYGTAACAEGQCQNAGGGVGSCSVIGQCRNCLQTAVQDSPDNQTTCQICEFGCDQLDYCTEEFVPGQEDANAACPNCGGTCNSCTYDLGGHRTGYPIMDIQWHPSNDEYIVSTAADGAGWGGNNRTFLWNPVTDARSAAAQIHATYTDSRTINEMGWNPQGSRLAFALSDGNVDKMYGIDDDNNPLVVDGHNSLTWQGFSSNAFNGCTTSNAFSVHWLDETVYVISGVCDSNEHVVVNDANLSQGQGSVQSVETGDQGTNVDDARFAADKSIIFIGGNSDDVYRWNWGENFGSPPAPVLLADYPGFSNLNSLVASQGGKLENLFDDYDYFGVDPVEDGQHHFTFALSQQFLQEIFYMLYYSGFLCLDISAGENETFDSILETSTMKAFVPALGDVDTNGDFIFAQNEPLRVKFRPKDVPIVKVLGGDTSDCFPDGDLIPSSGIYNSRVDDANLEIHNPAGSGCPAPAGDEELSVYDIVTFFPHFQVEFHAPLTDSGGPPYSYQRIFTVDWSVGLAAAVEYSTDSRTLEFGGEEQRYFEIMIDAFLGCGGDISNNQWGSFTTNWYGDIQDQCGVVDANLPGGYDLQQGIGDVLFTLLNSTLSTVLKTRLTLAGLDVDFYKVGAGIPEEGDSPSVEAMDNDSSGLGAGSPDMLIANGRFFGALDISSLFNVLSFAPPTRMAIDTELDLEPMLPYTPTGGGFQPASVFDEALELTPRESFEAGFKADNPVMALSASMPGLDSERLSEHVEYSWRLAPDGLWKTYGKGDRLQLPRLPSGKHTVEVKARGPARIVDSTPAKISFYIDRVKPSVRIFDAKDQYVAPEYNGIVPDGDLKVLVQDNLSDFEAVDILYSVDDGPLRALVNDDTIPASEFDDGETHTIYISASDEFENIAEQTINVTTRGAGAGCSATGGGGPLDAMWLALLALPLLALLRRRGKGAALTAVLAGIALALPAPAAAETSFEYTFESERLKGEVAASPAALMEVPLAPPPSPSSATNTVDNTFFFYLNGMDDDGNPAPGGECDDQADASCLSALAWVERTMQEMLDYTVAQDFIQDLINDLVDTGEPLLDETIGIPLIGDYNMAMYITDLWGDSGNFNVGPRKVTDSVRIGNKFKDDDQYAIDFKGEILEPNNYTFSLQLNGADDGSLPLGDNPYEGTLQLNLDATAPLDADVVFKQPLTPTVVDENYYIHAGGKMRLKDLSIEMRVYTLGGNLRDIIGGRDTGNAVGYGAGLGLDFVRISGGLHMDLDVFDCWDWGNPDHQFCDIDDMSSDHPEWGNQSEYEVLTNDKGSFLADAFRYLETHIVYEGKRASGAVEDYLTATELVDLRSLSHTEDAGGNYLSPKVPHPFSRDEELYLDYGLFWRFNGQADGAEDGGMVLPGGFGVEVSYPTAPNFCDVAVPSAAKDVTMEIATGDVHEVNTARDGRDAMFGAGVHLSALNGSLDQIWRKKGLCIELTDSTPIFGGSQAVTDVLNTETLRPLMPGLGSEWTDRAMSIRFIPRYVPRKDDAQADTVYNAAEDQPRFTYCSEAEPCGPSLEEGESPQMGEPGPYDMHVELPHLEVQFLADDGDGSGTYLPLFSVEVTLEAWIGLGWYELDPGTIPSFEDDGFDPTKQGCHLDPYPCRALRISLALASNLNRIYEFNGGGSGSLNPDQFEKGISSILSTVLSAKIEGQLELPLNLDPLLGFTMDPVTDGTVSGVFAYGVGLEALDMTPADGSNQPQYVGIYLKPSDVIGQYDSDGGLISETADGYADTLSPVLIWDLLQEAGLLEDLSEASLAPNSARQLRMPRNPAKVAAQRGPSVTVDLPNLDLRGQDLVLDPADAKAAGFNDATGHLQLSALLPGDQPQGVRYQYRIDGGAFQFAVGDRIPMPYLFDGKHTIEVWGISKRGTLSGNPARIEVAVDRLGPDIDLVGDTSLLGQGGRAKIGVEVSDLVSPTTEIDAQWRIDDGEWQAIASGESIDSTVGTGSHLLEVRAVDGAGNESVESVAFAVEDGGFGCTSRGAGGTPWTMLMMLVLLGVFRAVRLAHAPRA